MLALLVPTICSSEILCWLYWSPQSILVRKTTPVLVLFVFTVFASEKGVPLCRPYLWPQSIIVRKNILCADPIGVHNLFWRKRHSSVFALFVPIIFSGEKGIPLCWPYLWPQACFKSERHSSALALFVATSLL